MSSHVLLLAFDILFLKIFCKYFKRIIGAIQRYFAQLLFLSLYRLNVCWKGDYFFFFMWHEYLVIRSLGLQRNQCYFFLSLNAFSLLCFSFYLCLPLFNFYLVSIFSNMVWSLQIYNLFNTNFCTRENYSSTYRAWITYLRRLDRQSLEE